MASAAKSFHLDQYRQAGKDFSQCVSNEAAELLEGRDADSQFEGVMLRLSQFDDTWSLEDIDEITSWLARATENDSKQATWFLRDDWPARCKILKKATWAGGWKLADWKDDEEIAIPRRRASCR